MRDAADRRATGAWLLAFVVALNLPYVALVALFGYDDVLREPPGEVLARFHAAGPGLVWAWLAFALGALAFAPLAPRIEAGAGLTPGWSGPASAIAQFAGLARWVFVVPGLAAAWVDGDEAARRAAESTYQALHAYLGSGIGEVLGQLLLIAWTARLAAKLWRDGRRVLGGAGLATLPLWVAGLTEPLGTVLAGLPLVETTPLAFMGWEAWLAALGLSWLIDGRRSSPATSLVRQS
jgi:hypothetical protein